jgi:hypothetical protein
VTGPFDSFSILVFNLLYIRGREPFLFFAYGKK